MIKINNEPSPSIILALSKITLELINMDAKRCVNLSKTRVCSLRFSSRGKIIIHSRVS